MARFRWTAVLVLVLALASSLNAEERWVIKFEPQQPAKYVRENPLRNREVFWYVIYKVTNVSKDVTVKNMCLDIWLSTDARYRVLFPLEPKAVPGIEGFEREIEREKFNDFDELRARTRWGEGAGQKMPRYEGSGACYHDTLNPVVETAIETRVGRELLNTVEINEKPLAPGETREGVAIFQESPLEEEKLYADILNHLYVQSEERRDAEHAVGRRKLEIYARFFPEGRYIDNVRQLLDMGGNLSSIASAVGRMRREYLESLKKVHDDYQGWMEETRLFTEALMHLEFFEFDKAVENLDKLYQDYPKGEHRAHVQRLRILAKQKLVYEVREAARELREKMIRFQSLSPAADRLYLTVSGLADPVFGWKEKVYAQVKLQQFVYHRSGDETLRDFDLMRLVETRWYEPEPRFLRKLVPDPAD